MSNPQDLKTIGLKVTGPRLRILALFERTSERSGDGASERHLAAEDIYRHLAAEGIEIGLATIYRVLTQFEQAGLLRRHHFESGKAVYELNDSAHHDHIVCLQCGRVEEFMDEEIERRQAAIATERGYRIRDHSLHLYAECTKDECPHRAPMRA